MTRAAPSRLLGLADRGHLQPGAVGDVAVYRRDDEIEQMLGAAQFVFKNGELVVKDGAVVNHRRGKTLHLKTSTEKSMMKKLEAYHQQRYGLSLDWFDFPDWAVGRDDPFSEVPCRS